MIKVSMREFSRNIGTYMKRVHKGEKFIITKRDEAIADLSPHKTKSSPKGWSVKPPTLQLKNISLSEELVKFREEERS